MLNDVDESTSLMKELIESNIDSAANTLAGPLSERWLHYQKQRRSIFICFSAGIENRSSTYMNAVHCCGQQGGITCGTIDEPRKSSKAIDERVIINFRDKDVVIVRFRDKNV